MSVIIAADNRAGAIDCKCGSAELGPWRVDCHEFSIVTQEAVEIQWPGQLVNTDDITVIVDSQHLSRSSAGNIYSRKPASPVNKPMNRVVGIEVRANNSVAVVKSIHSSQSGAGIGDLGVFVRNRGGYLSTCSWNQ